MKVFLFIILTIYACPSWGASLEAAPAGPIAFKAWPDYEAHEIGTLASFINTMGVCIADANEALKTDFVALSSEEPLPPYQAIKDPVPIGEEPYQGVLFRGNTNSFVGSAHSNKARSRVIINFAYPQTLEDWKDHLKAPMIHIPFPGLGGRVHQGFLTLSEGSVHKMLQSIGLFFPKDGYALRELLAFMNPTSTTSTPEFLFCGQGIGGAISVLSATLFLGMCEKVLGPLAPSQYKVLTFSAPQIGDETLSRGIHDKLGAGNILTFRTFGDPIPRILRPDYATVGIELLISFEDLPRPAAEEGGAAGTPAAHGGAGKDSADKLEEKAKHIVVEEGAFGTADEAFATDEIFAADGALEMLGAAADGVLPGALMATAGVWRALAWPFAGFFLLHTHRKETQKVAMMHKREERLGAILRRAGETLTILNATPSGEALGHTFARWKTDAPVPAPEESLSAAKASLERLSGRIEHILFLLQQGKIA